MLRKLKIKVRVLLNKIYFIWLSKKDNISIKENVYIDYDTEIIVHKQSKLLIGKNTTIRSFKLNYHAAVPFKSKIFIDVKDVVVKIGDDCRLNFTFIHSQKKITIGNKCLFASGVQILDSNGHIVNSLDRRVQRDDPTEIFIGNNVWIGLNCIILKGTYIGDNSVISANSVVKGKFPKNSIITGNPAIIAGTIKIEENNYH